MARLLGLDIGTTSTIGILIDGEGRILATASRPSDLVSRHANWAEESPAQWWDNCRAIVAELLESTGTDAGTIAAVGVTGMVPTVVLLDEEGRVLRDSIQQNDARAVDEIEAMRAAIDPERFFALTGGSINQQLVAPKLRWLQRHEPDVMSRARSLMGSYDYIAFRLTDERTIDHNWALESGLMSLAGRVFEPELVALAGIGVDLLAPIRASHEIAGEGHGRGGSGHGSGRGHAGDRRLRRSRRLRLCGGCGPQWRSRAQARRRR